MNKKIYLMLIMFVLGTTLFAQNERVKPKTFEEQFSYAVGYDVTKSLVEMHAMLDKSWMMQGIVDAFADSVGQPLITKEEMELVFQEFQKRMQEQANKDIEVVSKTNKDMGTAFATQQMEANKKMKRTSSGLVYLPIKEGKGKNPTAESTVTVMYKGELIDGTLFDESSQTVTFKLNEVIPGWTEGLQLMKAGAIYKLIIPSDLAYGDNPPPGTPIQAGSTLVFTVNLLRFETPK